MSRIDLYPYGDGITKISDPFWLNICPGCGHMFWSCSYVPECPECGNAGLTRTLGGIPYEQIAARRRKE